MIAGHFYVLKILTEDVSKATHFGRCDALLFRREQHFTYDLCSLKQKAIKQKP
jgi:hypothetical protein